MCNIMHKDRNRLEVKQINWQDIRRKEQGKSMISVGKEMHQAKGALLQEYDFKQV